MTLLIFVVVIKASKIQTTSYSFSLTNIVPRATIAASVTNITKTQPELLRQSIALLLYGHGSRNSLENKQILLSTIQYKGHTSFRNLIPAPPPPSPLLHHRCLRSFLCFMLCVLYYFLHIFFYYFNEVFVLNF